jgi:polysaccharide deacetylase 2 family uncharacterized protein YibQ
MDRDSPKKTFFIAPLLFIVLVALCGAGIHFALRQRLSAGIAGRLGMELPVSRRRSAPTAVKLPLREALMASLSGLETTGPDITEKKMGDTAIYIEAKVPRGRPVEWFVWQFRRAAVSAGSAIEDCVFDEKRQNCLVLFAPRGKKEPKIRLRFQFGDRYLAGSALIAVVIENFGFEANSTTMEFLSFPEPLTVALVPSQRKSSWTAQIVDEYNKEIIIQVPMEAISMPSGGYGPWTIMVHFPEEKIERLLGASVRSIPNFSGFANRFGSRVLEDSRVMRIVFDNVKKHHAYFLDTYAREQGRASELAQNMNVEYRAVDAHIPPDVSADSAGSLLRSFCSMAQLRRSLVVSAPPGAACIGALIKQVPYFKRYGIKLVYLSELIRNETADRAERK